jgi:hypothetical protein
MLTWVVIAFIKAIRPAAINIVCHDQATGLKPRYQFSEIVQAICAKKIAAREALTNGRNCGIAQKESSLYFDQGLV